MNVIDRGIRAGVVLTALLGSVGGSKDTSGPATGDQTAFPACFPEVEVFRDLPPELSHYYSLKPGEVVESPFALSHAPGPGESVPVDRFREGTECLVFAWSGRPGGAGGIETRVWDENGFPWKRIKVNPLQGGATKYDTKGPIRRGRS